MPLRKWKLSQNEAREYRHRHSQLEKLGVAVGRDSDYAQQPASKLAQGLRMEPIEGEPLTIFDLPGIAVAVVLPIRLLVLSRELWITRTDVLLPWDSPELELSCEDSPFYDKVTRYCIPFPPRLLNPFFTGEQRLPRVPITGVIVAIGSGVSVPAAHLDHTLVPVKLYLYDELDQELHLTLEASVDRSLKVAHERRLRRNYPRRPREPIFKGGELFADNSKIVPESANPSVEGSIEPHKSAQRTEQKPNVTTTD